jgi:glycosyltransferase involved in cell wall biosynthesis
MKALVIAPQPFFSPRGTPFSVYYRTLVTAELGLDIDLLTYGEGQDVDISGVRIIRIPRFRFLGPVKIGPSYVKLFLDFFIFLWTLGLLSKHRYEVVHAHEEAVFICLFLKPLFGFKLVYDMHSSLPQQLSNFRFTTSKFLISIFEKLEEACLRAADVVITICPDLAGYASRRPGHLENHFLIENSIFDPVRLDATPPETAGRLPSLDDAGPPELPQGKKLIVYAGTLEPYQGIDILVRSLPLVLETLEDAFLVIVGGSDEQVERYEKLAREIGVAENTRFTGRVAQSAAKKYCSAASVLVSPRSDGTNTPLKVYEQLASGIPLVATRIYSHTQVLTDDLAILVTPKPGALAAGIIQALADGEKARSLAERARKYYEDNYSRPVYRRKIQRVLEALS